MAIGGEIRFRDWFARHLGVDEDRKEEVYVELSQSVSLFDATYWLQIVFAAGIATLGLVLNSPAVIIGAMLISPLMGPILASGLALAAADFVLGFRAGINLLLSCLLALLVAVALVSLLPFKEITHEITARTEPTTLDLVVALFSGAIGSIVTCKRVKSVVTSIPGVAVAVALMPPLSVVGYGLGSASSVGLGDGMQVARGGGLLFLTNLFAITFMAMIVFLVLHLDTRDVKVRVRKWQETDRESLHIRTVFERFILTRKSQTIGSLPARFFMIGVPLLVLLLPLSQSFRKLNQEIKRQQSENRIRNVATNVWNQHFARFPNGKTRSYIDQLNVLQEGEQQVLSLRVFSAKPYSVSERAQYVKLVAADLNQPAGSVSLEFIDIPTSASQFEKAIEQKREPPPVQSIAELYASFSARASEALNRIDLPAPAQLIEYRLTTTSSEPLHVEMNYLSERDIDMDGQKMIDNEVKRSLNYPTARISLKRIPVSYEPLTFTRNGVVLTRTEESQLDLVGEELQQRPLLVLHIIGSAQTTERAGTAEARAEVVKEYMVSKWNIPDDSLKTEVVSDSPDRNVSLRLSLKKTEQ